MRTDAFGGAPASPTPPAPTDAAIDPTANASPPANALNQSAPEGVPAPPAPTAPAAPKPPKAAKPAADAKKTEPHMPKVGNVTAANPTGAPEADASAGSNSAAQDEAMTGLLETVAQLGQAAGQGANSLGELAVAVCAAAKVGTISVAARAAKGEGGSDDVALIYGKYREAMSKATVDRTADKDQTAKDNNQITALRVFAKLGAAEWKGNAPVLLAKARAFINDKLSREETGKSSYACLIAYGRAQLKAIKDAPGAKGGKSDAKPMSNDALRDLLVRGAPPEDTRSSDEFWRDGLASILKAITKLRDGSDERPGFDNPDVDRAYEQINRAKVQLDKKCAPPERANDDGDGKLG